MGKIPYRSILKKLDAKCEECGTKDNLSINHRTPMEAGGTNDPENLQILCRKCHNKYHGTDKSKKAFR